MSIDKIKKWNDAHAFLLIIAGGLSLYYLRVEFLSIIAMVSFFYYVTSHRDLWITYQPFGGYANWVTSFRLGVLISLGFIYQSLPNQYLTVLLLLIVVLDVVDGYLARKMNQQSDFGLYFDMETDAFFVALVTMFLYLKGLMPSWILIVGFMRYLNVAIYQILQLKPKKEPKQRFASVIAGTLFVVLAISFVLPPSFRYYSLLIVSILVMYSFGRSFLNYLK